MAKDRNVKPLKTRPAQVLIALAMVFQVKDRIKMERWMVSREIVHANPHIFTRIKLVIERDYNYDVELMHLYEAVSMYLTVMKIDIAPRPSRDNLR